jgi:hypothetical protein
MISWLLAAHIAVLGYWLGAELVINSSYRFVCFADDMPFAQRDRLMDHVMVVDQHVRYALVLQATLGTMLAASYGFFPGGQVAVYSAGALCIVWLVFVESVHRLRKRPVGKRLAVIDRASRYFLLVGLVGLSAGLVGNSWAIPDWLRWKLAAFAGVMACGVGIRFALIRHFRTWGEMAEGHQTPGNNAIIKRTYLRATSILGLLWVLIAIIVVLSIDKLA